MTSSWSRLAGCGDYIAFTYTDHAPTGSLLWLYPLYQFQNGCYICNEISILNMCNYLGVICPRVPGDITDPMVPISNGYIGLFRAKRFKMMGAHHTGDWPAGPPTSAGRTLTTMLQCFLQSFFGCSVIVNNVLRYGHDDVLTWKRFQITGPLCCESISDTGLWCFLCF